MYIHIKNLYTFNWAHFFKQDRVCKPKNPTHVSNPSKGHYLKKTPSPTGHKSPPGHPLVASSNGAITDELMQRKPLLTQVRTSTSYNTCVYVFLVFHKFQSVI